MSIAIEVGERSHISDFGASWKFQIGQSVSFGDSQSFIMSRQCSAMGRQLYYLRIIEGGGGRNFRWVLGDAIEKPA